MSRPFTLFTGQWVRPAAFSESGYLSTTPSGEEIRRYPYES